MSRKVRIHELAKELGVDAKELVTKLDRVGLHNKRPQNSLTEEEADRVKAMIADEKPTVTVGDERVVSGGEGETVVERRVNVNVIRRRVQKTETVQLPEELVPLEALPSEGGGFEPFSLAEPLPEPVPPSPIIDSASIGEPLPSVATAPVGEPAPVVEAPATGLEAGASSRESLSEPVAAVPSPAPVAEAAVPPPPPKPRLVEGMHGVRVLGKIDLRKVEPPPSAADRDAGRGPRAPRGVAEAVPLVVEADDGKPRKKKRRVIQKPETAELSEQDRRRGKIPRKKKALPGKEQKKTEITVPKASKRVVRISEVITVGDLAKTMGVKAGEVIRKLMDAGMMATINQVLDFDTASLMAAEFEYAVENVALDVESMIDVQHEGQTDEQLEPRPPVVTIMGHVDHGKTSLLDAIRQTNVTAQEAGGITQHIGAYSVEVHGRTVTFLDTPGHEAFTAMRARGAKVTDMVVLVVAADDSVMPQTVEAINHSRAAGVHIIVAINKIDKPDANVERVKQALADYGLVAEDWGGDTICVPVSAKSHEGIPQLLEMLLLQADILELKANPNKPARGTIVEAKRDRGRGPVATVLVQEGTLRVADPFVCGEHYGRVRAMVDDKGHRVKTAGPSTPVEIIGLEDVPDAGNPFAVVADLGTARQVATHRADKQRDAELNKTAKVSLEQLYEQIQAGDVKELRVVIKADVQGSVEALTEALSRLSTDEVRLNILHAGVGGITETDILLASGSNAVVIGFNVRPEPKASAAAEREGVDVRLYTVIYDALNDVRDAMEGLLEPTTREKTVGRADVRQVFTIPSFGVIAGSYVTDGKITRNAAVRLLRDNVVVHTGKVASLRRFKEDAREVQSGYECGIGLEGYTDVKVGDVIEVFETEQVVRRLTPASGRTVAVERRV